MIVFRVRTTGIDLGVRIYGGAMSTGELGVEPSIMLQPLKSSVPKSTQPRAEPKSNGCIIGSARVS